MTLLTVREVAERLRLGKSTVYLLIKRGEMPAVHFGGAVRVPQESLEVWLARMVDGADLSDMASGAQDRR